MYKFGTIVLVPFPFTDLTQAKLRPALIVSHGLHGENVIVAFLSSNLEEKGAGFTLLESSKDFKDSGLKGPSRVRFDKLATLDRRLFLGEIGRLSSDTLREHAEEFRSVFGF